MMEQSAFDGVLSEQIFQNPFIGITIADGRGVCLAVNDAQTRITGLPKHEFVGCPMQKIVEKQMISVSSTLEVLRRKKEVDMHQHSGSGKSYEVKAVPFFGERGEIRYVISYLLDVTEAETFKNQVRRLKIDNAKAENQIRTLVSAGEKVCGLVYYSDKMARLIDLSRRISPSDATVLITGPSGTGKELIANLIHQSSQRNNKPFVKLNCAAIPEHLLESELFGYEPGAFTGGSQKGSIGLIESAQGGSLLLDEIGEMSLPLQAKLLRVLQDKEVRRIGADRPVKTDVRFLASTNAPLEDLIAEKKFREDLYYRLNVITIDVPGLEERRDDIPVLITHFLKEYNAKYGMEKLMLPETITCLAARNYPGNVRELQNVVERLILQSPEREISLNDAFDATAPHLQLPNAGVVAVTDGASLQEMMNAYEKHILQEALTLYGKPDEVARRLQIDRSTISRKFKKYGL